MFISTRPLVDSCRPAARLSYYIQDADGNLPQRRSVFTYQKTSTCLASNGCAQPELDILEIFNCLSPPATEKDCQLMANKRRFDLHPLKPLKPKRMTHRPETHPPGNTNVAGQCPRQSAAGDAALQLRCQGQSHRLCPQGKPLRLPNFHSKLSIFKNDFKMSSSNPASSKPVYINGRFFSAWPSLL